jgi:hypothetical protein
MAFHIDIGFATQAGRKPGNEDFCAAMLPDPGRKAWAPSWQLPMA